MSTSLIDRDQTRARELAYPDTAGHAIKAITMPMVEAHCFSQEKYIDWVQELLKRADVHWAVKLAIIGGENPLVFGGSIPAIMMAKLEPIGLTHGKVGGSMTVSESNKASQAARTGVQSTTNAGVGTPFWHVNENLVVTHSSKDAQVRSTDYRARIDWETEWGPMGEPEGVGLIKEACGRAFDGVMKLNQTLVDAQLEHEKEKMKQLPTEEDADEALSKTDIPPEGEEGQGDSGDDSGGDEPPDKTKIDDGGDDS